MKGDIRLIVVFFVRTLSHYYIRYTVVVWVILGLILQHNIFLSNSLISSTFYTSSSMTSKNANRYQNIKDVGFELGVKISGI